MCGSSPKAPEPPAPLPPVVAPPVVTIESAEGRKSKSSAALTANRGRGSLRIDRTQSAVGPTGSGLNIPS